MNATYFLEETISDFTRQCQGKKFRTILADPPWQFQNRTGKMAPEHKRLNRYPTMTLEDIKALPVAEAADEKCHLYLCPLLRAQEVQVVLSHCLCRIPSWLCNVLVDTGHYLEI